MHGRHAQGDRANKYAKVTRQWGHLERAIRLRNWTQRNETKAWAALIVGALSLAAVAFDYRWLKLLAATVGMALPLLYIVVLHVAGPRWARAVNREVDALPRDENHPVDSA